MRKQLIKKIRQKIAAIKSDDVKSISQGQLDLLIKTNASSQVLEDFLDDVTFVVDHQMWR
ncbi:hypothetical protein HMPREF2991_02855 [Streptococcus sp. HMSC072D07]|uniref:hypothetical protein n=1 Tax=Streptococcus sp. HMSC072D07 TaxID=1739495 RepID=UPI0008A46C8C|nr:hypothetical protein [Streptococcus sp. HMSC072D07]OFP34782.1 hypothetical protein HMPREF2991_02855 [Streptococcus sp. HMSC072D07]